jgi:hypothetical protein
MSCYGGHEQASSGLASLNATLCQTYATQMIQTRQFIRQSAKASKLQVRNANYQLILIQRIQMKHMELAISHY